MEVTPWLNTDANCCLVCDFGGYHRDDEWGFTIEIPEGTVISADGVMCARSEFRSETAGVGRYNCKIPTVYSPSIICKDLKLTIRKSAISIFTTAKSLYLSSEDI